MCRNAPADCREVEFKEDGSWVPVLEDKEDTKKRKRQASDSDDSDAEREQRKKEQQKEKEVMSVISHRPSFCILNAFSKP